MIGLLDSQPLSMLLSASVHIFFFSSSFHSPVKSQRVMGYLIKSHGAETNIDFYGEVRFVGSVCVNVHGVAAPRRQ